MKLNSQNNKYTIQENDTHISNIGSGLLKKPTDRIEELNGTENVLVENTDEKLKGKLCAFVKRYLKYVRRG